MSGDVPAASGILPAQAITGLTEAGAIRPATTYASDQIQPASLDLRLGTRAYRVRTSFLPGSGRSVAACVEAFALHEIDLTKGAVLETGCVYIAELQEALALPRGLSASANPKSSTGRIDVFTRVITDRASAFDQIEAGYAGPLYAEISPRTFPVRVRTGSRLSQIRFRQGDPRLREAELAALHASEPLIDAVTPSLQGGVPVSVDLSGFDGLIGYRAKRHTGLIDVDRPRGHRTRDFWEPLPADGSRTLILDPGQFYILASKEAVRVPADHAAEMVPFDPLVGEFRVHYAGFFDPGFGLSEAGGAGARAVLEVRSRDVPFLLEDGQIVGRLVYERMLERPATLYGSGAGSNYQAQGLKLSKHFASEPEPPTAV
ncbi:2'-deoxycytidine 5'-triphosphate deaminase [Methylorubrum rhodesianum]|jgi:dCTP deaminase|uniref:2'-deoxycytidine 5'-triphosphate deaminase n=1 Tax=Methylorubrum TaxID=2282523 RepID=UPI00161CF167|nr:MULTISPECIES: 2'-deoxycytidine 5'-triphosphate deaminase [Methylorubrum]MBB5760537.1 dCTP deaminase [Methylorubrum rhodesianum]MBI1690681.1 2'-deoxycytidine 5'-triphosphate deaminase [Methylorubrum sp. DB1722]